MPVRLRCQCGQKLTLPEQKPGLRVQCPVCSEYLTIPDAPPAGPTELVAAATTKVQAELVAAISGVRKAKPSAAKESKGPRKSGKSETRKEPTALCAKERPLPSPPKTIPVPAPPRPEPRAPTPRAAPQPPPRKSQARDAGVETPPVPPTRPVASQPAPTPPPLPTAKVAVEPAIAPLVAIKITPPEPPAPTTSAKAVASPAKSESPAEPIAAPAARGVEHDPAKRLTVYQLGFGLAMLALASSYPAIMEIVRHVRDPLSTGIENWTYLLVVVCVVQLVYALYLVQLPDWSSVWVTMIVTATVAFFYALGMGMSLMAGSDNEVIASLGLSQLHAGGYLSLWCLLLTLLTALLSYAMIRTSVKWQKMFALAMSHAQEST